MVTRRIRRGVGRVERSFVVLTDVAHNHSITKGGPDRASCFEGQSSEGGKHCENGIFCPEAGV